MSLRPTSTAAVTPYKYVVQGTNDIAQDGQRLRDAIAAFRATSEPRATIWARGEFHIDADVNFWPDRTDTRAIDLVGYPGDEPTFRLTGGAQLIWDSGYNMSSHPAWQAITNVSQNRFQWSGAPPTVRPGQVLGFKSDDVISGAPPHIAGWTMLSLEMHQHVDIQGSDYWTDHTFADPMSTNPMAAVIPMVPNVRIANITITEDGTYGDYYCLILANLRNSIIENVRFGDEQHMSAGGVYLKNLVDGEMTGCEWTMNQNYAQSFGYGVVWGNCLNHRIQKNKFAISRHPISTGNTVFSGGATERRGTSIGCIFDSNLVKFVPRPGDGLVCLDNHQEGHGLAYTNNVVHMTSQQQSIAFNIRARATIMDGNKFIAGPNGASRGGYITADDAQVTNNTFKGFWYGPATSSLNGFSGSRQIIAGNEHIDCAIEGLRLTTGDRTTVTGEKFIRTGHTPGGTGRTACIYVTGGTNTRITMCDLEERSAVGGNATSINTTATPANFEVRSNNCQGYGSTSAGFAGSQGAAWESAFGAKNDRS